MMTHSSYHIAKDPVTGREILKTDLKGSAILSMPQLNKGTAFDAAEREIFELFGKLPYQVETLDEQLQRVYFQYIHQNTRLRKYIYLDGLRDKNLVLFFKLLVTYAKEILPVIYTPTLGTAVKIFNQKLRRASGLYLSYPERDQLAEILDNRVNPEIDLVVVTDGERVLGLGDQGVGAIDVVIAKSTVYTLLGGISPYRTLPIVLDVGTNNQELLNDPMYVGWRHERVTGENYDQFIDQFVNLIQQKFPKALLHWEDFGRNNATRLLNRYRNQCCTFNNDLQGTGVAAAAAILAAVYAKKEKLSQQQFVILGGGTAGLGIADRVVQLLCELEQLTPEVARSKFWIVDQAGLLLESTPSTTPEQQPFLRKESEILNWVNINNKNINLETVVKYTRASVLIGCSSVAGAFTQSIIQTMYTYHKRPIILPLSNPTSKSEAIPSDVLNWTEGNALIATGSPFEPVEYNQQIINITQCNNALVFPFIGLAVLAVKASRVTEGMLNAAVRALLSQSPILNLNNNNLTHSENSGLALLFEAYQLREHAQQMALIVAQQAVDEKLCAALTPQEIQERIEKIWWDPQYAKLALVN